MGTFEAPRNGLCLYECLRLFFLIGVFLFLEPSGNVSFPWLAIIAPAAMFLLIALFLRLNMDRYLVYIPLYLAGKGLSIIATAFWLFFSKSYIINDLLFDRTALYIIPGIILFMLLGDIVSVWQINRILKRQ
jgi:hypothetical protein